MAEVLQDALHVPRIDARHEVKAHQVVGGLKLSNFLVLCAVVHLTQTAPFHQAVLFKAHLTLKK